MSEFTFNGKTYKVVKDTELIDGDTPCKHCVFQHVMHHRCITEQTMYYLNSLRKVPSCRDGKHHYRDIE